MFSDEKTFQSSKNGRLPVYRSTNTRFEENYTLSTTNSGRFSVNVWAWISVHDPGVCWQIAGRLTSAHYTNILENVMLPSARQVFPENFGFQHFKNHFLIKKSLKPIIKDKKLYMYTSALKKGFVKETVVEVCAISKKSQSQNSKSSDL
ncbi:hypothetical protein NQ318_007910 [Aromia moschata]|uniref:Uncharacterized protein n=1 Tax=Aromia moschata TaxID=1265417 RepID=A0AAV8XVH0_9CUCU|nr:hypothetical protein NQ318_007910 [Aromia moschata]